MSTNEEPASEANEQPWYWGLTNDTGAFLVARIAERALTVRNGSYRANGHDDDDDDWTHHLSLNLDHLHGPEKRLGSIHFVVGDHHGGLDLTQFGAGENRIGLASVGEKFFYATIAADREMLHDVLAALNANDNSQVNISLFQCVSRAEAPEDVLIKGFELSPE